MNRAWQEKLNRSIAADYKMIFFLLLSLGTLPLDYLHRILRISIRHPEFQALLTWPAFPKIPASLNNTFRQV
jgi:hypothetical protein